jgi:hypothetical protein
MLELQKFATNVIESIGGIVEPLGYSLMAVVLPDDYYDLFHGKIDLKLAFDFEVHQENEDSEFITFGSSILNSLLEIANSHAICAIRYVVVDKLKLLNPESKIKNYLNTIYKDEYFNFVIDKEVYNIGLVSAYTFNAEIISDITINEEIEIWINMSNTEVLADIKDKKNSIFFENKTIYGYPLINKPNFSKGMKIAYMQAKKDSTKMSLKYFNQEELGKELLRINNYYDELLIENQKRTTRKGVTSDKIEEINSKNIALKLEKDRQISEMKNKYNVKPVIRIENGAIYHFPVISYYVKLKKRKQIEDLHIVYNIALKQFSIKS